MEKEESNPSDKKVLMMTTTIGLLVFGDMFFNKFVWDDISFIVSNLQVHSINIPLLFGINLFNDTLYYRPIPALYSAIVYSVAGVNVFPYHFLQFCLHIACSFLLFLLFSKYMKRQLSFLLSLVFLVHPMNVESVSFIAQTVSPLFFFFGILALYFTINKKKYSLVLIPTFLLLSLLTKETGILFVFLILLFVFLFKLKERFNVLVSSIASTILYLIIRLGIGHVFYAKSLLISPISRISMSERIFTIPSVAFYYLKTFILPLKLSINQHWLVTSSTEFYLSFVVDLLLVIGLCGIGIYIYKHSKKAFKIYLFFATWFILGILFHLQIVPLDMTVADRWFYFPMAGLLGLIGVFIDYKFSNKNLRKIVTPMLVIIILIFGLRTMARNTNWIDEKTLYRHDIKVNDNFELENNLGWTLIQEKDYKDAIVHLKKSTDMWDGWDRSWYNLGVAYHFNKNIPEAKKAYESALLINENNAQIIENLSYLTLFYYDPKQAKKMLNSALDRYPTRPKLWYFLSLAEYKMGNKEKAFEAIKKAHQLDSSDQNINSLYNLMINNEEINFQLDNSSQQE